VKFPLPPEAVTERFELPPAQLTTAVTGDNTTGVGSESNTLAVEEHPLSSVMAQT
jgi:hypothetical protein